MQRRKLSKQLHLSEAQVQRWFVQRRKKANADAPKPDREPQETPEVKKKTRGRPPKKKPPPPPSNDDSKSNGAQEEAPASSTQDHKDETPDVDEAKKDDDDGDDEDRRGRRSSRRQSLAERREEQRRRLEEAAVRRMGSRRRRDTTPSMDDDDTSGEHASKRVCLTAGAGRRGFPPPVTAALEKAFAANRTPSDADCLAVCKATGLTDKQVGVSPPDVSNKLGLKRVCVVRKVKSWFSQRRFQRKSGGGAGAATDDEPGCLEIVDDDRRSTASSTSVNSRSSDGSKPGPCAQQVPTRSARPAKKSV